MMIRGKGFPFCLGGGRLVFSEISFILISLLLLFTTFPIPIEAEEGIQQQINNAESGTTIYIESGVYNEKIIISKPLTLIGNGDVTLNSQGNYPVITIDNTQDVQINHINMKSNNLEGNSLGIKISNSKKILIKDVTFNLLDKGIDLFKVEDSKIDQVILLGREGHFSSKSNGITLDYTKEILIENTNIESVQDGIYVKNDVNSKMINNEISHSRYGIHLMYSNGTQIVKNHLHNNVTGVMHMLTSNTAIIGNIIEHQNQYNGFGIVLFEGEQIHLSENKLLSNQVGISFQSIENSTITKNTVALNQTGFQFIKYASSNQLSRNEVYGNIVSSVSDKNGAIVNENYWDDYEGVDLDLDGYGDTPYQSNDSYAKLMIKQKEYQFFFESPSVATLSKIERKLPYENDSVVRDDQPFVQRSNKQIYLNFNAIPFIIGSTGLVGGWLLWRRMYC